MSRVLVTGAGGFIGRVAVRAFLAAGWQVRAAARSVPADAEPDAEWLAVGDVREPSAWQGAAEGISYIIHLAGRAHMLRETTHGSLAIFRSINVEATRRLASEAARAGVRRFVFMSSIGVNGQRTDAVPFRESDAPRPSTPYAVSKWEAEQTLRSLAQKSGMEYVILRAPLVYGAQVPGNFRRLVKWVGHGWPLPIAAVDNRRSMIYVENLADALLRCAAHPAAANQSFVISDRQAISTPDLVRLIAQQFAQSARLWRVPESILRIIDVLTARRLPIAPLLDSLVIDPSRIEQCLGWIPPCCLKEGLRRTLATFR